MSAITTHILDVAQGRPAGGVVVTLEYRPANGEWKFLARGLTDADGRITDLLSAGAQLELGDYKLAFETGEYFSTHNIDAFYPEVAVIFTIREPGEHYHVPLLLSPFGYSTYRGS
jgi:5-hydroxyisourate hydrolase